MKTSLVRSALSSSVTLFVLTIGGSAVAQTPPSNPAPDAAPSPQATQPNATALQPTATTPAAGGSPPQALKYHGEERWYGWQTLTADGVSVVLMAGGMAANANGMFFAGWGTYLLGAPIIHFIHGGESVGKGFGSFVIRLLVPPLTLGLGAVTGLIVGGSNKSDGDATVLGAASGMAYGALAGLFVGMGISSAIDAALLAREKVKVADDAPSMGSIRSRRAQLQPGQWYKVQPTMNFGPNFGSVGVTGTF